jgi:Gas vesicle protein G
MGLITGLLTLPLAPVRGTMWIAERVLEQAEREYYDEGTIMAQLMEIEAAVVAGTIEQVEAQRVEDELVERLIEGRQLREAAGHG